MPLLSLQSVTFRHGTTTILADASLTIAQGDRVAVVGRNGAGKSTLLRVVEGSLEPDEGRVDQQRELRIGRLHQEPPMTPGLTARALLDATRAHVEEVQAALQEVFEAMGTAAPEALDSLLAKQARLESTLEAMGGWDEAYRVDAVLEGVGLGELDRDREVRTLSGGERARLELARVLLESPDVLLLDEPTNHLDLEARRWLEAFLQDTFKGAVMLVTHDRWLLQAVCTRVIEINGGALLVSEGGWDQWQAHRAQRSVAATRAAEKLAAHVRREQAFIRRYKAGQRAKQARGRASRLERHVEANTVEVPDDEAVAAFDLPVPPRSGDMVVEAVGLIVGVEGTPLLDPIDIDIRRGEHVGIVGPNGTGKTTLLRTLLGELPSLGGTHRLGAGLRTGWFRQDRTDVDPEAAIWLHVRRALEEGLDGPVSEQAARNLAGAFLFSGDMQDREMGACSGGERARAVMAGLLGRGCNLLVLDEPTNHLDIPSAQRIEAVLGTQSDWPGTLIVVSHDRALLQATCSRLLVIEGGALTNVLDVEQWLRGRSPASEPAASPEATARVAPPKSRRTKLQRMTQQGLEDAIETIELELGELNAAMSLEENWSDPQRMQAITDRVNALQTELRPLEDEWGARADAAE